MDDARGGCDGSGLAARLAAVYGRIERAAGRVGRDPAGVALVAVSKRVPAALVAEAFALGQRVFGESYVQEGLSKREELAGLGLEWHFIGALQKNKAKYLPGKFALVHSVDDYEVARILHERASAHGLVQDMLIQVNLAGEAQKAGVAPGSLAGLAERIVRLSGARLMGLMVLPPFDADPEASRPYFARLREAGAGLAQTLGMALPHLSMGMSGDLEPAVEEGATLVRVGADIFGSRVCGSIPA
ncbi:MAG: YggS family pyridoxal phosphate-dependent enzyme [Desulfovibrionaceae bacterium]|nr:YggS family pyridoxal phosphate-dependent enzyme [Desulfovibrionaceae bacterium]MBF0512585.1 YggS family pyridoxal phosphate-dependent enzyme [Desulfovibrionaceae bacterium]